MHQFWVILARVSPKLQFQNIQLYYKIYAYEIWKTLFFWLLHSKCLSDFFSIRFIFNHFQFFFLYFHFISHFFTSKTKLLIQVKWSTAKSNLDSKANPWAYFKWWSLTSDIFFPNLAVQKVQKKQNWFGRFKVKLWVKK